MTAPAGALPGPRQPSIALASANRSSKLGSLAGTRSGGSIYGSPGGSGPLLRAALLVIAVIVLLVLVARNCTGSDGSEDDDFEDSVTAGVASIDPDIVVTFDGDKTITLSGEVPDENTRLNAESQAVLAGAEEINNEIVVVASGSFSSADPAVAGALQTAIDNAVEAGPITFQSGSSELTEESTATLDQIAAFINGSAGGTVLVVGHTDNVGTPEGNLEVSEARANSVRIYLVDAGVDPLRVNSEGRGDTEPIADNETEEGRAANRRIAFIVQ